MALRQNISSLVFSILFVLLVCTGIALDNYYLLALPAVGLFAYLLFYKLDFTLILTAFLVPLSINMEDFGLSGISLYLPTEPILVVLTVVFLLSLIKNKYPKEIIRHPITVAILFQIFWMLVTSITSQNPVVSFKYFATRLWFVLPCYFMGIMIFKNGKNISKFLWAYSISLLIVVFITVVRHYMEGFSMKGGHFVMQPFFKDHTSYGAIIALFIPFILLSFWYLRKQVSLPKFLLLLSASLLIMTGFIFSYTRAAWVSLIGAIIVLVIMRLRIPFKTLLMIGLVTLGIGLLSYNSIVMSLERNDTESSDDFSEHVESAYNVSSDASNLERINRWKSAIRMGNERPLFGFGPGTYMFYYAPYQKHDELTIISTNFGNLGNAHSEYLGPYSESGILGIGYVVFLLIVVLNTAINLYYRLKNDKERYLLLSVLLGLITYFTHGILNNYLDTDKASVPFWAFIAIISCLDIYSAKKERI